MATDLGAIALENAKLSSRGAIRRSHCAITWLGKLQMLRDRNLKPTEVLMAWNSMATKDSQVLGGKRMALLNLLELPRTVGIRLLEHISKLGPQTTFSDECWASKKLQPGTAPRLANKQWNQRLTVTGDGVFLMVDAICTQQEERLPVARRKVGKDELEEGVLHAQMVLWMEQAVIEMGIPSSQVTFREDFIKHDHHLLLEVATAVSEKSTKFDLAEMSCVQKLLKAHRADAHAALGTQVDSHKIQAANLEKEEMDLVMKSIESLGLCLVSVLVCHGSPNIIQKKHNIKA